MNYDVFNGDADGITSLVQLRLAQPKDSVLVTGVKRDISLLKKIKVQGGDDITVLDVSLAKNHSATLDALEQGATVFYVDHHAQGDPIEHERFTPLINTAPDVCTALLVNGHLKGVFPEWAVVGAFGDNLKDSARRLAQQCGLSESDTGALGELGVLLNYNGYGLSLDDLHFAPDELYSLLLNYTSPLDFIRNNQTDFLKLRDGYAEDLARAEGLEPCAQTTAVRVFQLPNAPWARRINGVWGNELANESPDLAHAVLVGKPNSCFMVSVRAPLNNKQGAGTLCSQFKTGGGREAAAGINDLPEIEMASFIEAFSAFYAG
ncbi:MAG: DHH family phosphoesterase [Pseudomonadota bacterium]